MHKFIPLAAVATACAATPISAQQAPPQLRGKQHKLRLYSAEELDRTGERTEKKWWGEISCCERYCGEITRYDSANVAADLLQIQNLDQLDEYKQDLNGDSQGCTAEMLHSQGRTMEKADGNGYPWMPRQVLWGIALVVVF
jgi:hypothetical protein